MLPSAWTRLSVQISAVLQTHRGIWRRPAESPYPVTGYGLFFRFSGTSPLTIRCARPSTTAVLPTPATRSVPGCFWYGAAVPEWYGGFHHPADHRVQLAGLRAFGQVDTVFVQRLTVVFRIGIVHSFTTPDILNCLIKVVFIQSGSGQYLTGRAFVVQCHQQEYLTGNKLIARVSALLYRPDSAAGPVPVQSEYCRPVNSHGADPAIPDAGIFPAR